MNAKLPSFIRGRAHDPAQISLLTANNERLALQGGVQDLFNRREKRVHIDMKDSTSHVHLKYFSGLAYTMRVENALPIEIEIGIAIGIEFSGSRFDTPA
jgi:hypothetical protein